MSIYIPFTYVIGWSKHRKFYYGAKYAQGCHPNDLWTTYFTSSKYVAEYRKENGEPDIIKIHRIFSDKDSCVLFETRYLTRIDAQNNPLFLNESNGWEGFGVITENSKQKKIKTYLTNWGYESHNQSPIIKIKKKESYLDKFGYESHNQSPIIKEKKKETFLNDWGVENISQNEKIKEKKKQTCLDNFGVEFPSQSESCREKSKQTSLKNWGTEHPSQSNQLKEKKIKTNLTKWGVEYPSQLDLVKEKSKETCIEKYGVEFSSQSDIVKEKRKQTFIDRYGYGSATKSQIVKEKTKQTNMKRYGYESHNSSSIVKENKKLSTLEKYGVDNVSKIKVICKHCGELKGISHESSCKLNPNRKQKEQSGINNPMAKTFNVTDPKGEVFTIQLVSNLECFAKRNGLKFHPFRNNKLKGWNVEEVIK